MVCTGFKRFYSILSLISNNTIFCLHEFGDSFSCGWYFSFPERTKKRKIRRKTRTLRAHREGEATFFYVIELIIHSESSVPN